MTTATEVQPTPAVDLGADPGIIRGLQRASGVAGVAISALGVAVVVGWLVGLPVVTRLAPGLADMRFNTAAGLVLVGLSVVALGPAASPRVLLTGRVAAYGYGLLGLATLVQHIIGRPGGFDTPFGFGSGGPTPGRMPITAAACLVVMAISVLAIGRGHARLGQFAGLAVAAAGALAVVGYAFDVDSLYEVRANSPMALHTAIGFAVGGLAVLGARPGEGFVSLVAGDTAGGVTVRRMLVPAVAGPAVLGGLLSWAVQSGTVTTSFGLALFTVSMTLLSGSMVWVIGASLRHVDLRRAGAEDASRRADAARRDLEQTLALLGRSEERLRRTLETAGDAFISVDGRGLVEAWNRAAERTFGWPADQALGRPLEQLIIPASLRPAHRAGLARITAGGPSRILDRTVELTAQHRDGSDIPVELTVWATHGDDRSAFNAFVRDISVRKATEASTRLLAAVVENSMDAILTIDPDGTVVSWNSGAEHLYGYRADEMIGRNAVATLAPPGDEADREGVRRRLGQGESTMREVDLVRADGRAITVSVTSSPILDADGCLLAVSSISRDITDDKETKRALAASEERYRSLADTATDLVTRISPTTGKFVYVSPSVEAILGWTPEELVGRRYADFVDPVTVSNARIDKEVIAAAGTHTRNGIRVRRRDGTWAWCDSTSRAVVDPTSGELEIRSSTRDVTARVEAERELAASEERFRLTQLHSPMGLAVVGLDGRWLQVNPALCQILGRTEGALLQLTFQDLSHPEDLEADLSLLEQTLRGEIPNYQTEKRYFRGDGELVWVLLSVALVRDGGEPVHLIAQLLDITARKRDQEALDKASARLAAVNEELVEVGRVKDHVLAVTNHELRTPLSSIVGFSDVLATDWHELSDERRLDFVERIRQSGWRMKRLVDDFLFAVELASGTLKIEVIAAELGPVLDAALARAGATRAGVSVACPDGLRVRADPDRLAQILTNYLTNATKYGDAPVAVEAVEAGGFVEIRVKDRGPGVSPEFVSSIFDRFNPASRGTDFAVRGTGLGLAIARGLAHAQGGEAWYEPNSAHGAIFGVRVPASC